MNAKVIRRTKGKYQVNYGIQEMYTFYVKTQKEKGKLFLKYDIYRRILKDFNKGIMNYIIKDVETIKLKRLGKFSVVKQVINRNPDCSTTWPIDYERSKKLGFIVYSEGDYRYKFKWQKSAKTKLRGYSFIANRAARKSIEMVRQGKDYYSLE